MDIFLVLCLAFWIMGLVMGAILSFGVRFIRRWGAMHVIKIMPGTDTFADQWIRPKGKDFRMRGNKRSGDALVTIPTKGVYSHWMTNRKMLLVDASQGVALEGADQSTIKDSLGKFAQAMLSVAKNGQTLILHPGLIVPSVPLVLQNGFERLAAFVELRSDQIKRKSGLDLAQVAKYGLLGLLLVILMILGIGAMIAYYGSTQGK